MEQYNEQPNFDFNPYSNPYKKKPNKMANLSLLFGVLSLLSVISIYVIYFALPLGSLSILFAHLSKGDGYRLPGKSLGAAITSVFAILLALAILVLGFYFAIRLFGLETLMDPDALQKAITDLYSNLSTQIPTGGNAL